MEICVFIIILKSYMIPKTTTINHTKHLLYVALTLTKLARRHQQNVLCNVVLCGGNSDKVWVSS